MLAKLGYRQELNRSLGILGNIAIGFAVVSPVVALYAVVSVGTMLAGPAWVWVLPVCLVGQLFLLCVYSELASQFPISGNSYQWTRRLMGPSYAWSTGWLTIWAGITANTAVAYLAAPWFFALFGWTATPARLVGVAAVFLLICALVNFLGISVLGGMIKVGVVVEVVVAIGIGFSLLLVFRRNGLSTLTDTLNAQELSGGSAPAAFLAALAVGGWVFIGFDACVATSEETKAAARHVPRAIWWTLLSIGGIVILNSVAIGLSHPAPKKIVSGEDTDPVSTAVVSSFGGWSAKPFSLVVIIAFGACLIASQAAAARGLYSIARDDVLPASSLLRWVNRRHVPMGALGVMTILSATGLLFGLSRSAVATLITFGTAAFYLVFLAIALGAFIARVRRTWVPAGQIRLGRIGTLLNALAVLWLTFETVNVSWPRPVLSPPGAPWYQVWAAPLTIAVILISGAIYLFTAHPQDKVRASASFADGGDARRVFSSPDRNARQRPRRRVSRPADLALVNTHILTFNAARPTATALAVRDGSIIAVGDDSDIRPHLGKRTDIIAAPGSTITPGLIDSHQHPIAGLGMARGLNLTGVTDVDELRQHLTEYARTCPPEGWVIGYGVEYAALGRNMHRDLIDDALEGRPSRLTMSDGHNALLSTAALRIAGITESREFGDRSEIVCDERGPTGELRGLSACLTAHDYVPAMELEELHQKAQDLFAEQNRCGLTGIHVLDDAPHTAAVLTALAQEQQLTVRVRFAPWCLPGSEDHLHDRITELRRTLGPPPGGTPMLRLAAVKFFLDCVIDSGRAWLHEPDTYGQSITSLWKEPSVFEEAVRTCRAMGLPAWTHAVGDRAVNTALNAYHRIGQPAIGRYRIEHVELLADNDVTRFADLDVIASVQPTHMDWIRADRSDNWSLRIGPQRMSRIWRYGDIVRAGGEVALGSDWPVAGFDPRTVMASAQLRRPVTERDRIPLLPQQALTCLQALAGYTTAAASASGEGGFPDVFVRARTPISLPSPPTR
ncbi:amino acid permease [Streptomyces sp. CA-251387]|uniref:amino acid permease n=1 Tax=Streptomyces sp. CA-251387 TaxID=3240064 RepID=UPI003D8E12EB